VRVIVSVFTFSFRLLLFGFRFILCLCRVVHFSDLAREQRAFTVGERDARDRDTRDSVGSSDGMAGDKYIALLAKVKADQKKTSGTNWLLDKDKVASCGVFIILPLFFFAL
jgi:hypothetical protein